VKLIDQKENAPVLSNVGEVGEFRIRNSAKAFSILSSGLYANKIRAIIRELSCNAVDSHAAAGHADRPFDVHLPNILEPWFSIHDYGVGLSHEQIINIYTTYFESTKTLSNEFIGALGLGSKSPFSYTENFTVTSVKDGVKGIYTAFINDQGVPSIALMMSEDTTEPNGVEVKFAVEKQQDFRNFGQEAAQVYSWFRHQPVISGQQVYIPKLEYQDRDIIPGVHLRKEGYNNVAVMGNIAYPIDVPSLSDLGPVAPLLNCGGLVMEFAIGELDFQASREGLSYIPATVAAIRSRLEALNLAIEDRLEQELDKIPNEWERLYRCQERAGQNFWQAAALKFFQKPGKFNFQHISSGHYAHGPGRLSLMLGEEYIETKFNIRVHAFHARYGTCSNATAVIEHRDIVNQNGAPVLDAHGRPQREAYRVWYFDVSPMTHFVVNDTKNTTGSARAKAEYRRRDNRSTQVFVLSKVDLTKEMKLAEFFALLNNPPRSQQFLLSTFPELTKPKALTAKILQLKPQGYWSRNNEWGWCEAGILKDFDDKVHYYVSVSGYSLNSTHWSGELKGLLTCIKESGMADVLKINLGNVYAVRKSNLEDVKALPNWVNFEEHLVKLLSGIDQSTRDALVSTAVDQFPTLKRLIQHYKKALPLLNSNTDMAKFIDRFGGKKRPDGVSIQHLNQLTKHYAKGFDLSQDMSAVEQMCKDLLAKYPMLTLVDLGNIEYHPERLTIVTDYVNMIK
jgi:hypothetical protein